MFDRIQHIHYPNVQKVLPAVYGDELSYYELLAKFEDKINSLITLCNELGVDVTWAVDAVKNIADLPSIEAQVQALQETANTIQETLDSLLQYFATPEMYGAKGDGINDDTVYVQEALDSNNYVLLTNRYRCTSRIRIDANSNSYKIVKLTGTIICENSYVWITGFNCCLNGGGNIDGYAPESLIILGALENTRQVSCINATVENLKISGTIGDNACGGLIIRNYFLGNYGAYCNTVRNIYFENTTFAINLIGDSNANNISNINLMSYDNSHIRAMFIFSGIVYNETTYAPMENIITSSFYYRGLNTPMVLIENTTANRVIYNTFSNLVCEQQGSTTSTVFIRIQNGAEPKWNIFTGISSNTYGGYFPTQTETLLRSGNNTFIADRINIQSYIQAKSVSLESGITLNENRKYSQVYIKANNAENTLIPLFTANGVSSAGVNPRTGGCVIEVTIIENSDSANILQRTEHVTIFANNSKMVITQSIQNTKFSIDGNTLYYRTGNNGTALTNIRLTMSVDVISYFGAASYLLQSVFGV